MWLMRLQLMPSPQRAQRYGPPQTHASASQVHALAEEHSIARGQSMAAGVHSHLQTQAQPAPQALV